MRALVKPSTRRTVRLDVDTSHAAGGQDSINLGPETGVASRPSKKSHIFSPNSHLDVPCLKLKSTNSSLKSQEGSSGVRFKSLCSNLSSNPIASSDQNHQYATTYHSQRSTWIAEGRVVVRVGGSLTPCDDDILFVVNYGESKH